MNPAELADRILSILAQSEDKAYIGEPISQLQHALQCAHFAKNAGCRDELVLGALFHNIGHLCAESGAPEMDGLGILDHESIGAACLLKHHFSEEVARLVRGHVQGKRYLVRNPGYSSRLSMASQGTLAFQGGAMTDEEAAAFERDALFKEMVQLRKFDELAKDPNLVVAPLESYFGVIQAHLVRQLG